MYYQIENTKSAELLGIYEADSPEAAIRAMQLDAGADPEISDAGIIAYEVSTVQMVSPVAARQNFIAMQGEPEDLDEWLDSLTGYEVSIDSPASGWGEYTYLLKLVSADATLYYLAPGEAVQRLRLIPADAEILAIIVAAFEERDRTDPAGDWTGYVDSALAKAGIETGEELDGSDPDEIVRLADGRIIVWSGIVRFKEA